MDSLEVEQRIRKILNEARKGQRPPEFSPSEAFKVIHAELDALPRERKRALLLEYLDQVRLNPALHADFARRLYDLGESRGLAEAQVAIRQREEQEILHTAWLLREFVNELPRSDVSAYFKWALGVVPTWTAEHRAAFASSFLLGAGSTAWWRALRDSGFERARIWMPKRTALLGLHLYLPRIHRPRCGTCGASRFRRFAIGPAGTVCERCWRTPPRGEAHQCATCGEKVAGKLVCDDCDGVLKVRFAAR